MATKIRCPDCGRKIVPASVYELVTCDGCEHQFDPLGPPRQVPRPSTARQLFGWILVILGSVSVFTSINLVMHYNFQQQDSVGRAVGAALVPIFFLAAGFKLINGKKKRRR